MTESDSNPSGNGKPPEESGEDEPIPMMQRILDNPFLLLFLGVAIPAVLYLIWGIMEVAQIPMAQ